MIYFGIALVILGAFIIGVEYDEKKVFIPDGKHVYRASELQIDGKKVYDSTK